MSKGRFKWEVVLAGKWNSYSSIAANNATEAIELYTRLNPEARGIALVGMRRGNVSPPMNLCRAVFELIDPKPSYPEIRRLTD